MKISLPYAVLVVALISTVHAAEPYKYWTELKTFGDYETTGSAIAVSPDGRVVAFGGPRRDANNSIVVQLWDIVSGQLLRNIVFESDGHLDHLAFDNDGRHLAAAFGNPGVVKIISVPSGKIEVTIPFKFQSYIAALEFSPDGRTIAVACKHAVRTWRSDTAEFLSTLPPHEDDVMDIKYSKDGKLIATAGQDGVIMLINSDDGTKVRSIALPQNEWVRSIAFSPDSSAIAAGVDKGNEYRIIVFKSASGEMIASTDINDICWDIEYGGQNGAVINCALLQSMEIRSAKDLTLLKELSSDTHHYMSGRFTADGTMAVTASSKGGSNGAVMKIWGMPQATRLRALFVIDTNCSKIGGKDSIMRPGMEANQKLLGEVFDEIFRQPADAGRSKRVTIDTITGDDVTPDKIFDYYRTLDVEPSEALFFYYCGHGAWDTQLNKAAGTRGPFLATSGGDVSRVDLRSEMLNKNARLTVIITDCCSSYGRFAGGPTRRSPAKWVGFRNLFFEHEGLIDFSAATESQRGWISGTYGGFMTSNLTKYLCEPSSEIDTNGDGFVHWTELFERVRESTRETFKSARDDAQEDAKIKQAADQTPEAYSYPQFPPN